MVHMEECVNPVDDWEEIVKKKKLRTPAGRQTALCFNLVELKTYHRIPMFLSEMYRSFCSVLLKPWTLPLIENADVTQK